MLIGNINITHNQRKIKLLARKPLFGTLIERGTYQGYHLETKRKGKRELNNFSSYEKAYNWAVEQ